MRNIFFKAALLLLSVTLIVFSGCKKEVITENPNSSSNNENVTFTIKTNNIGLGDTVFFLTSNTSNAESLLWDFGDGNTSTDSMPYHVYKNKGEYTVQLKVDDTYYASSPWSSNKVKVIEPAVYYNTLFEEREWNVWTTHVKLNLRDTISVNNDSFQTKYKAVTYKDKIRVSVNLKLNQSAEGINEEYTYIHGKSSDSILVFKRQVTTAPERILKYYVLKDSVYIYNYQSVPFSKSAIINDYHITMTSK